MSLTDYNRNTAFTYIELIVVMVVIAILSVSGAALMSFFIQSSIFIPNQLNVDMLTSEAVDTMIEGDAQAKGLRFNKGITAFGDNQITFTNENDQIITYQLDMLTNKLYRQINAGANLVFPYYWPSAVAATGKNNKVFTYYDVNDNPIDPITGNPANVKRVAITVIAKTGTGTFNTWDGQTELTSSIAVTRY